MDIVVGYVFVMDIDVVDVSVVDIGRGWVSVRGGYSTIPTTMPLLLLLISYYYLTLPIPLTLPSSLPS